MEENPWSFKEVLEGHGPTIAVIALGLHLCECLKIMISRLAVRCQR